MPWRIPLAALGALVGLLVACDPIAPRRPDADALGPPGAICSPDSTATYASFGRPFFERYWQ